MTSETLAITASDQAAMLIEKHGSIRLAAKALKMDHAHLYRIAIGKKGATAATLKKLGLMPTPLYLQRKP